MVTFVATNRLYIITKQKNYIILVFSYVQLLLEIVFGISFLSCYLKKNIRGRLTQLLSYGRDILSVPPPPPPTGRGLPLSWPRRKIAQEGLSLHRFGTCPKEIRNNVFTTNKYNLIS